MFPTSRSTRSFTPLAITRRPHTSTATPRPPPLPLSPSPPSPTPQTPPIKPLSRHFHPSPLTSHHSRPPPSPPQPPHLHSHLVTPLPPPLQPSPTPNDHHHLSSSANSWGVCLVFLKSPSRVAFGLYKEKVAFVFGFIPQRVFCLGWSASKGGSVLRFTT
uniref:Uncharacterized protein n=1 Tax=Tanacetum cinerariifolium TaxID=118510 RepID=A0A699IQ81_TANCI|nr:hypothetical protein [Tanacetum cinerariifolium]